MEESSLRFRWRLAWKILGVALLLLTFVAAGAIWSVRQVNRVNAEVEVLVDYYVPIEQLIHRINVDVHEQETHLERTVRFLDDSDPSWREKAAVERRRMRELDAALQGEMQEVVTLLRQAEGAPIPRERTGQLGRIEGRLELLITQHAELQAETERVLEKIESGVDHDKVHQLIELLEQQDHRFEGAVDNLSREMDAFVLAVATFAASRQRYAILAGVILTACAAFVGLFAAKLVTEMLVRPVRNLVNATESVRGGLLDTQVEIRTRDEIEDLGEAFNDMVADLRLKRQIEDTFGRFLDPRIVAELLEGERPLQTGGTNRDVTVLFMDIKGFTSISEQLTAESLVKFLNEFLRVMSGPIQEERGVMDKFIGDSIMAYWCAPFVDSTGHAAMACRAALRQVSLLEPLQRGVQQATGIRQGLPELDVRIGINTGEVVVGSVGPEERKDYTAIGDEVNLAARLERANKYYGTRIIVSEAVKIAVGEEFECRELDRVRVRGREEPVRLYELLSKSGELDPELAQLRERYGEGLQAYFERDWETALRCFTRAIDLKKNDGPSLVFASRIRKLMAEPPAPDWDGVWRL